MPATRWCVASTKSVVGRGRGRSPSAAVVPPPEHLRGIRDSKQLTRPEREVAAAAVRSWAVAVGVGHASYEECDELGMTAALRAAGYRALAQLDAQGYVPDRIVLDGNYDYLRLGARVTTVIKGDVTCLAAAAASCVAKVTRDALDARRGGALSALRLRVERGISRPGPQGRACRLRAERDPPPIVDLHGRSVLARAPASAWQALHLTMVGERISDGRRSP